MSIKSTREYLTHSPPGRSVRGYPRLVAPAQVLLAHALQDPGDDGLPRAGEAVVPLDAARGDLLLRGLLLLNPLLDLLYLRAAKGVAQRGKTG